jgi:hypothetical protein
MQISHTFLWRWNWLQATLHLCGIGNPAQIKSLENKDYSSDSKRLRCKAERWMKSIINLVLAEMQEMSNADGDIHRIMAAIGRHPDLDKFAICGLRR